MCPLERTRSSPARSRALAGVISLGDWVRRRCITLSQERVAPSPQQRSHTEDQKLFFSSPTPSVLLGKLPPCPRLLPTFPQACYQNRGLEKAGKSPEPPHPCHLGTPGLAVCSYSRRTVFIGPFWQISVFPKSLSLTAPIFNTLLQVFCLGVQWL